MYAVALYNVSLVSLPTNLHSRFVSFVSPSLFEVCPESKILFGFPKDIETDSEHLLESKRFLKHATFLIQMIDKTVNMLGVDNEQLSKTLTELGEKHVAYGVKPDYFPNMTESIVFMLEKQLGKEKFQYSDRVAWNNVLGALIADMVKGQRRLDKGLAAANKSAVIKTWRILAAKNNYEEHAGVILFK